MCATNVCGSWTHAILDEIALEGLEGVTLPSLWLLLSKRLAYDLPFPLEFQSKIWTFLLRCTQKLQFYELPVKREPLKLYDRYEHIDEQLGVPLVPEVCPFTRYKFEPIQDGHIFGSCEHYKTRKLVDLEQLRELTIEQVMESWGTKLVLVATQELRYEALTPTNVPRPKDLTAPQYSLWECIGRARYNGETASGPWSLMNMCKDSSIIFYIKNKLLRLNVVSQQFLNEKRGERFMSSNLLSLPRFFRAHKSHLELVIEKLYFTLKEHPENRITTMEARNILPSVEKLKSLKKIMVTHVYRQIFNTSTVPYTEIHKDAKGKDRKLVMISLHNPDLTLEQLYQLGTEQEKQEKQTTDFLSDKHAFVDMPLEEQCLRAIVKHGKRGISQPELSIYLGINALTVRTLVKYLQREKIITVYPDVEGRQRIMRYVARRTQQSAKSEDDPVIVLKKLKCADEPVSKAVQNIPATNDVVLADLPNITAQIRRGLVLSYKTHFRENFSKRQVARKALIVQLMDERCFLKISEICKAIKQYESKQGYKDAVCRKSVFRILETLCEQEIVNCYEITLKYGDQLRLFRYVTHPKIDETHSLLQREIIRLKNCLYLITEERKTRPSSTKRIVKHKQVMLRKQLVGNFKTMAPKLLLARALHEFLYYIAMELSVEQCPLEMQEGLLQQWQRTEPAMPVQAYFSEWQAEEEIKRAQPYRVELNWRTFIPPLPIYENKPSGWVYFTDAIERIPLSIFNKFFRIERYSDEQLQSYLKHPIRQHYLMSQLPDELQKFVPRIRLQNLYVNVVRLLNNMGLVQVSERQLPHDPLMIWIYINRQTRILDTTPSEPGYAKVSAQRKYSALKFEFIGRDDVAQYWSHLQRICIYTKLGFRRKREELCGVRSRFKTIDFVRHVTFDEAPQFDNGTVPGDRLGAAGLSSNLYAHQFRHWSWVVQTKPSKLTSSPKMRISGSVDTVRRKQGKQLVLARGKARVNVAPIRRLLNAGVGTVKRVGGSSKKSGPRDDIDRDALKNMRTLRVCWCKDEDKILKMARAVYLFIAAPLPIMSLLHIGRVCRDIIRQHLGICNKTSQACVRRMQFLMRMKRDGPDVHNWLYMLQSNQELARTYNDEFLENLKAEYPVRADYADALLIHFTLVLSALNRLIHNTTAQHGNFLLPDTLEEYTQQLRECIPLDAEEVLHHANPTNEKELQVTIAQCVLHSTLCSARDKTLYNSQAFEIYKHFSEEVLNNAFTKSRAESLVVSIKRRNIQSINRVSGPAFLLSSKYKNRLTYLRIHYTIYDSYYDYEQTAWQQFFPASSGSSRAPLELKSPHFAQLLYMAEGLVRNYLRVDVRLPVNILTVDISDRQTVSATDRILDHYHSIFDNAPQTEYEKQIESDTAGKQVRVKFHPANLSYKIFYNAYDFITKLPQRSLHFFCALDHLHKAVDINFSKLQRKDTECGIVLLECPFHCILQHGNYINAIERIVHDKKLIIKDLSGEMAPQKLLNQATSGNAVIVQPGNLLTLVRMLETFWREKQDANERKDLGKLPASLKSNKNIDWQNLCAQILEYDPNESEHEQGNEYEPTLNKEERARAQDVFVVSLPTLQLQLSAQMQVPAAYDKLLRNDVELEVPTVLRISELKQKFILQKTMDEAYWKYTENTFETLRAQLATQEFSEAKLQHMQEILNFIAAQELGVTALDLKREFPFGTFLLKALQLLAEHYLIKRVGVSSFMYVHKQHIRNWIVHTFHIKRLERERFQKLALKRKASSTTVVEEEQVAAKKTKTTDAVVDLKQDKSIKRQSKPVRRYDQKQEQDTTSSTSAEMHISDMERDAIVMRPQPWMRVNGSLNRRVLDRWMSAVLSECITRTGCTVNSLFRRFPHMLPVDIMFLLELLCDLDCIHLMEMQQIEIHLDTVFEEQFKEEHVTELYDPTLTYVVAHADAIGHLSNFIGQKKYSAEFI